MFLQLGGIGAKIGADFEVIIKQRPATGHMDIDITDITANIKLRNQAGKKEGDKKLGAEINLDLEKTHANIKLTTEGNVEEVKNYLFGLVKKQVIDSVIPDSDSWIPDWAKGFSWRIGGTVYDPLHHAIHKQTQDIIDKFVASTPNFDSTEYSFSRNLQASPAGRESKNKYFNSYAQSFISSSPSSQSIKDALKKNMYMFNPNKNERLDLDSSFHSKIQHVQHQIKDDKIHYLVSPEHFAKYFLGEPRVVKSKLDTEVLTQMLDNNLPSKAEKFFGGKVKFSCSPDQKDPQLKGSGDAVVMTNKVRCTLNTENPQPEPLQEIELDLEFTIHPEVSEDGKSLKAQFGETQIADVNYARKGKTKISARISDKPTSALLFPGFADLFGLQK